MKMNKSYRELIKLSTFEERFDYLKIIGHGGELTFGFERYLNQALYHSRDWQDVRREIIVRDNCCDLGMPDREIYFRPIIHHLNPITIEDIENRNDCIFDFNNLICASPNTHNAIHFGRESMLTRLPKERTKGDTCPWLT